MKKIIKLLSMNLFCFRFGEVQEVVDVILFLLSDKSSMINAVNLPIDGGLLAV